MQDKIFILSIAEFLDEAVGEILMAQAMDKVDESRREKVTRIRQRKAKAASLGAGLLLQHVVRVAFQEAENNCLIKLTAEQLLAEIEEPIPLEFTYRMNGKPYLKEVPFYFNLSHSGAYVVCVISEGK